MPNEIPIKKCQWAMLASAIGDALGWPNEIPSKNKTKERKVQDSFVGWTRICRKPHWHYEEIRPGEYSDDTQMLLSVSRSLATCDWEKSFFENELPFWLEYERGGGRALLRAARLAKEKKEIIWKSNSRKYLKDYFNAGGNGAVMRILPHVIALAGKSDKETMMIDVIRDARFTHGHPRAILGATCYAYALYLLLKEETSSSCEQLVSDVIEGSKVWGAFPCPKDFGEWLEIADKDAGYDYFKEWEKVKDNMLSQLKFIQDKLNTCSKELTGDKNDREIMEKLECFGNVKGAGDVAIITAIYLASKYASDPKSGLKVPAFAVGADTDTIASITGGLLGMSQGTDWIPKEWEKVQDSKCLVRMAEILLSDDKNSAKKNEELKIREELETESHNTNWQKTPIGNIQPIRKVSVKSSKNGEINIEMCRTLLGQTIYIKRYQTSKVILQGDLFEQQPESVASEAPKVANQPSTSTVKHSLNSTARHLTLDAQTIEVLLNKPEFKSRVSVGKVLRVIQSLIKTNFSIADIDIAKRFDMNEEMVNLLRSFIN